MTFTSDPARCALDAANPQSAALGSQPPRVSVLMPVFNTVSYLHDAIQSIQRQSCNDFELVVIDDGSNDGSSELLKAMAAVEPRMKLSQRENRGLIATRNELLQLAQADLVAWMDSDDLSAPERLQLQTAAFAADDRLVCLGGSAQRIDPEGHPLNIEHHPVLHDDIVAGQLIGGGMRFGTTMMRRDVALRVGGFREPFRIGEDLDLLFRLSEVGKMANLTAVIYSYRQHAFSTFVGLSAQWLNYRAAILALAKERREVGSDRLQRGEAVSIEPTNQFNPASLVAYAYEDWARHAMSNRNFERAWRYAIAALRAKPFSPRLWKLSLHSGLRMWRSRQP